MSVEFEKENEKNDFNPTKNLPSPGKYKKDGYFRLKSEIHQKEQFHSYQYYKKLLPFNLKKSQEKNEYSQIPLIDSENHIALHVSKPSLLHTLSQIKQIPVEHLSLGKKLKNRINLHLKDVFHGTLVLSLVPITIITISLCSAGLIHFFNTHHHYYDRSIEMNNIGKRPIKSIYENQTHIITTNPYSSVEEAIKQVPIFNRINSQEQFFVLQLLLNQNKSKEFTSILNNLPSHFNKNIFTQLLIHNDTIASNVNIPLFDALINQGANWKANNYALLSKTARSEVWRHYWINYFTRTDTKMLSLYSYILTKSLSSADQEILKLLNN